MAARTFVVAERADTHTRVLAVALELIAQKGFAATSTREIAERLGFTKAGLYYHFRTKDDLLAALVAPAMARLEEMTAHRSVDAAEHPRHELLNEYVDFVSAHEALIRVLSQDPSVASRPVVLAARPFYERFTELLVGEENPDASQRTTVRVALGGIHAAILLAPAGDDRAEVRAAALAGACGALGLKTTSDR